MYYLEEPCNTKIIYRNSITVINQKKTFPKLNDVIMHHPNTVLSQSLYIYVYFSLKPATPTISSSR